jgi:hypothetical protein
MTDILTPTHTYMALLIVQGLHLLHHRLVKRHISYAETISSLVLCFPPFVITLPAIVFMSAHIAMIVIQLVGSIWIQKLSPDWNRTGRAETLAP